MLIKILELLHVHFHLLFLSFNDCGLILFKFEIWKLSITVIANTILFIIILCKFTIIGRTFLANRLIAFSAMMPTDPAYLAKLNFTQLAVIFLVEVIFEVFVVELVGKIGIVGQCSQYTFLVVECTKPFIAYALTHNSGKTLRWHFCIFVFYKLSTSWNYRKSHVLFLAFEIEAKLCNGAANSSPSTHITSRISHGTYAISLVFFHLTLGMERRCWLSLCHIKILYVN